MSSVKSFVRLKSPLKEVDLWCLRPFVAPSVRARRILQKRLLRTLLARTLQCSKSRIRFRKEWGGKPELAGFLGEKGVRFNLSHSADMLVVAVTRGRAVGVDVEKIKKGRSRRLLEKWTRKEALLKGLGVGLRSPWRQQATEKGWKLRPFRSAPGFTGVVAVEEAR